MSTISVIIPAYNSEKYIGKCLESLLNQRCKDFDIIIVDDGSIDDTIAICETYRKGDIPINIISQKNGGVSSARNTGIENSSSDWILFVDSDDYVSDTFIEHYYDSINQQDKSFVIFNGFTRITSEGVIVNKHTVKKRNFKKDRIAEAIDYLHIKNDMLGYVCTKIFNRSLIIEKGIRFDTRISLSEDLYFTLTYLQYCSSIITLDTSDYFYRTDNSNSLTSKTHDYLSLRKAVGATSEMFYKLCGNTKYWKSLDLKNTDTIFCSILSLFDKVNQKYDKQFIINEIRHYQSLTNIKDIKFGSSFYSLINSVFIHCSPTISYIFTKLLFKLK